MDPLLEQQEAGISLEVGLRQRCWTISGDTGWTISVTVAGLTAEEELVLGVLESFGSWLVLLLIFFLLDDGSAELTASMANAAWARVLTPTWADIDVHTLCLFKY